MPIYQWKFNTTPTAAAVEAFIDSQMPLFARYTKYLAGADGEPIVDTMKVEHNCGATNLEVQLNGNPGFAGDVFCFPGYYPGDADDDGQPLYNVCDTKGQWYGKVVSFVLNAAKKVFDMEVTTSVEKAKQYKAN